MYIQIRLSINTEICSYENYLAFFHSKILVSIFWTKFGPCGHSEFQDPNHGGWIFLYTYLIKIVSTYFKGEKKI